MGYKKDFYNKQYFETGCLYFDEKLETGKVYKKFKMILSGWNFKNKKILDVGCGRGEAIQYIINKKPSHILGIDFSRTAIAYCFKMFKQYDEIFFLIMEAKEIISMRSFDYILMIDVIEHIPNDEMQTIYPKIYSALKPSGILIIKTPFYNSQREYESTWDLSDDEKEVHINIQSKKRLRFDLEGEGFFKLSSHYYQKEPILITSMFHAYRYEILLRINNWIRRINNPRRALHFLNLKIKWWLRSSKEK